MSSSRRLRPISKLCQSADQRLNSYALAASAAGVGIVALTLPAQARIVYTPTHDVVKQGFSFNLDLNNDGVTDFTLRNRFFETSSGAVAVLSAKPTRGNGVDGWTGSGAYALALNRGAQIGSRQYFPGIVMIQAHAFFKTYYYGSWMNVRNRYLGLKFKIAGKIHYGWARLNVQVQGLSITAKLTGYAYETIPGKPIIAGKTMAADEIGSLGQPEAALDAPVPRPATLGLLAMGAPALSIWRREESVRVA